MSNYDLQAELSNRQALLAEIERENARLRGEINQGVSTVNSANRNITNMINNAQNALAQSAGTVREAEQFEEQAYQVQLQTENLYPLFKNMEEANKNIRVLKNRIYYDFANYRTVRKIMQGIMDNLDLSLIRDDLIYKTIEKKHIESSDFWLTNAMLAIMAWKNDQQEMAERAIVQAMDLDKKSTIMFFMIFNLRMGRDETALHWLMEYEKCEMTGEDNESFLLMFSLISKTVMENVSPAVNVRVMDFVKRIIQESRESEDYSEEEFFNKIAARLLTLRQPGVYKAPHLASSMKGYGDFTQTLDMAANNYNILERIASVINAGTSERNQYLKEFMDHLIARPNTDERETYEQIRKNEMVIRFRGDLAAVEEAFSRSMKEKTSQINLVSYMIDWVEDGGNDAINEQMRFNMFIQISDCEHQGVKRYAENYRARYKEVWPVEIGEYETVCNFQNYENERNKIGSFYHQWLSRELSKIKNTSSYIAFAVAVAVLAGGIYLKAYIPAVAGAVLLAAAGILMIILNGKKKEKLGEEAKKRANDTNNMLQVLFREFDMLSRLYHEFDAVTVKIDDLFAQVG